MSSSGAAVQYKLDANSNAIALITDAAALPPSPSALASPADRIEWSRATILNFIEDYRRQRVLWDPNTKGYHIKQTKYEALKLLSQKYGTEIRSIRSKIKSLRSSFHREHGKVLSGRNRGVPYQPMWFAYEAIRFILDGEHDADVAALDAAVDGDIKPAMLSIVASSEAADKLALMHSLDLEQLTAADKQQVEQQHQQQQQEQAEITARIAAAVAAVAAAAAANVRERDNNMDTDAANSDGNSNGCTGEGSGGSNGTDAAASAAAVVSISAAVTRSSSDLDGENYCNISAEDVKTEIIEPEAELGILDRQTSTPLSLSYYKPTDLTYNHRKRKAQMDDNDGGVDMVGGGVGVDIVGGVVGALTLTPIKSGTHSQHHRQQQLHHHHHHQQQQLNHSQIAFHALQQHFSHNLSHNGNGQPHQQQQQQQHSNNMAQKRDRDRDLYSTPTGATNNNNNSNSNHSSTSLELHSLAASTTTSSGIASIAATPIKISSSNSNSNNNNNNMNNVSSSSGGNNNLSPNHVDEYGVFGEYVAITIRKLKTSKSKIVVKHLINNLLYEAELGKYDQGMPASKEPPQLYKMQ